MKSKIIILTLFLLLVFGIDKISAQTNFPLLGKTIVVDVGHGGKDPGTTSGDTLEKEINLNISLYLESELSKRGATVILTREEDYDLSSPNVDARKKSDFDNRIKIINNNDVDLYLSIHLNYLAQSQYSGGQVFYNTKHEKSKRVAEIIQDEFNDVLDSNRDIKKMPDRLYMYDRLNPPGVLIECGFLSNYAEKQKLKTATYQQKIAEVIASAVEKVF